MSILTVVSDSDDDGNNEEIKNRGIQL